MPCVAQHLHEAHHVARFKNPFHAIAVKIGEGAFIQKRWIHHAASREVIDYEIEELETASVSSFTAARGNTVTSHPWRTRTQIQIREFADFRRTICQSGDQRPVRTSPSGLR